MKQIDVYLAHRNSTKFIETQVTLINKYFQCNEGSKINIFGYVDGSNKEIKENIRKTWENYYVTPIDIPNIISGIDRNTSNPSVSYGLAFTYVYQNYILKNNHISICIENDIFPFKNINVEDYIKDYEICGEVRFNAEQLPDRNVMFWLGFIIFNGELMKDRYMFSGISEPIININSGKKHLIDSGGQSYYWITKTERKIRQMVTNGNENYDGFTSLECTPHNITHDIECLPEIFKENYQPHYRVLVYDNCLLHLERMGRETDHVKEQWWNKCYQKLIHNDIIYIPIGFQCTTPEILKKTNKRLFSFPFDWIISTPEMIVKLFTILLEKTCDIETFVKNEFFKIDSFLEFVKQEEFNINPNGNILYNSKYKLIFPHFQNNNETIMKLVERFERLKNFIFDPNYKIHFLFINRIVNNNNNKIDNKIDNKIKFMINNNHNDLQIVKNFIDFNDLLKNYIPYEKFKIIVINAVEKIEFIPLKNSNRTCGLNSLRGLPNEDESVGADSNLRRSKINLPSNMNYYEIIPKNGSDLTDQEIINLNII